MPADVQDILRQWDTIKALRLNWETDWQRIADNMLPWQNDIQVFQWPGTSRSRQIFDTEAYWALDTFAAHLSATVTNFMTQWFGLKMAGFDVDQEGAQWFDTAARTMNEGPPRRGS